MTKYRRVNPLTYEEAVTYTKALRYYKPPLEPTGEVIEVSGDEGDSRVSKVVVSGSWTPYGFIRDCGDHYIIALYSRYDRISKDLQTITEDVVDF